MLNPHSNLAIAQIAFYAPVVFLAAFLRFFRHGRPRLAWIFLFLFCLVRIAGGVVTILLENDPSSVGLIMADVILLGVGVIPLMASTIGLIRIMCGISPVPGNCRDE
jgi:hypothetical protein